MSLLRRDQPHRPAAPRRAGGPGRPAAVLRPQHRLERPHRPPLPQGGAAAAGRGQPGQRRALGHRRNGWGHHLPGLLHRHRGRAAGLPGAGPARHRRLRRLHLGLLQHPRDRPAGGRARAGGHRRLRLHGPARRHADLRGGRRARGHGHPEPALPGHRPDDRRARRGHPALRHRPALVVRRNEIHHHVVLRAVEGHLRPLLPSVPAPGRRAVVVRQGAGLRRRDHRDPLLLRLHRQRRPGRRRASRSARRSAPRSSRSTSSTSSSRWPSGARRRPCGSRGSADAAGRPPAARLPAPPGPQGGRAGLPARARPAGRAGRRGRTSSGSRPSCRSR